MSQENGSERSYRFGYAVCAMFLLGFILVTGTVVSDSLHRVQLEQVVPQPVAVPTATPSNQ